MPQDLKDTLNLPKTRFPMRANLVEREPQRMDRWESMDLYAKIQAKNDGKAAYVLHDGPPFTNGDVHIGTALNKTLKDIILRYKSMRGFRTPYIPGWDCHGLPIEHKVSRERRSSGGSMEPGAIRKACAEFSANYIETQRRQFKRLGVLADWEREYRTMNPQYEATIFRTFAAFVEQGLVYRSKKPVYWSIPCATALAEAEIEYKDHVAPSIWVAFPLDPAQAAKAGLPKLNDLSVVIWTTTPWTLPANQAVAVHPNVEYSIVKVGEKAYLLATDLVEGFAQKLSLESYEILETVSGKALEGLSAKHPFINRNSPIVLAEYVTTESGTGCVHIAPGHGLDDYLTGLKSGLDVYCPLDDRARYIDDGEIPKELVGISVHEQNRKNEANDAVLELLRQTESLLKKEDYTHQYPHCWRSKTPVIFRAMDQWFVALDKDGKRESLLQAIKEVDWIPEWGENRIRGAVESRPDWCISRQRSWGVPLPVFYRESDGEPLLDAKIIREVAEKIASKGTDFWFEATAETLLEGIERPEGFEGTLLKGQDTLDVWIDSGCSHRAVLQAEDDLTWPADLYLEGSDQHRGWFQSSLWTAMIADGKPPYKRILTHGFIVNENKKKVSKSEGKPQTSDGYIKQYGADIVRLWIASVDYRNDIPISKNIFKQVVNTYRTLRNTFKFQLGNLYDFNPESDAIPLDELTPLDKWALHKTSIAVEQITEAYDAYEFHKVYQLLNNFCNEVLSATYHDVLKDRLYTYGVDWKERRSSQTAIREIFSVLVRVAAPVLTFTSDEAWAYSLADEDFIDDAIHLQDWPSIGDAWTFEKETSELDAIFDFRSKVNEQLEKARQEKAIGQSLDAMVIVKGAENDPLFKLLLTHEAQLPEYFIVSQVNLETTDIEAIDVKLEHAKGVRCPRSWRWVPELVNCEGYGEVSPRCRDALLNLNTQPV